MRTKFTASVQHEPGEGSIEVRRFWHSQDQPAGFQL
jgi:hypothetical protein